MSAETFEIGPKGKRIVGQVWTPLVVAEPEPILLFHDSIGSVSLWRSFPSALCMATARRVVAYDRLGYGQSDTHPSHLEADFIAAEARGAVPAILDALSIDRFIACGHSVGGGMAASVAAALPDRCIALVTLAAQAFNEERTKAGIRAAKIAFAAPENFARVERHHGSKTQWVLDAWMQTWLSPEFADWSLEGTLDEVRCPVLALHGALDEYGSEEHPRRIASGRGELRILEGVGHVPHREAEDLTVELIRSFLAARAQAVTRLEAPASGR